MYDLVVVTFDRKQIESCDFSGFLALYGEGGLPKGSQLRAMMDTLVFTVVDYDADPREIHEIPEVRRFYGELWKVWPFWFYFLNLDTCEIIAPVSCVVPFSVKVTDLDRHSVGYQFEASRFHDFVKRGFEGLNRMCDQAGIDDLGVEKRTRAIATTFGLL